VDRARQGLILVDTKYEFGRAIKSVETLALYLGGDFQFKRTVRFRGKRP
jgi:hypothetical protein